MSPQVMNLSRDARLLFIGLITQADDEGRGTADPRRIKASIFGGDDVTANEVAKWLRELVSQRLVVEYSSNEHGLLYELPTWRAHQKIDRPKPSTYPAPTSKSTSDLRLVDDDSSSARRSIAQPARGSEGSEGSEGSLGSDRTDRTPRAREAEHGDFLKLQSAYPKFAGRQDWLMAEHHATLRVEQGATWAELRAAVDRYAAYVAAGGVSSTAHVLTPAKFFSAADKPWQQPWELPAAIPRAAARTTWLPPDDEVANVS